ncbi:hypothetical protein ABEB36_012756 [Hypothenemus hampei]|uniref:DUF4817 domain-containing protein n=1 Tax=Hypothenemus hampei TaxID=57062 RepID=A0ABD1ECA4_HYPHA
MNNEFTDMLEAYFLSNKNSGEAQRLYSTRFPERQVPDRRKFSRLEENLRLYGAFKKPKKINREFNENVELNILLSVEENPKTSAREIAETLNSSKDTVQKVLNKHKYHPYIAQKVHHLNANDPGRRIEFSINFLNHTEADPLFYTKIIWSDECTFNNNRTYNRSIHRLNVWCGVFYNQLLGLFFIEGTLNQERYHELLTGHIDNFLDNLPLQQLNNIYFQQDGAAPHNARINVDWLNARFREKWIGTNSPFRWSSSVTGPFSP